MKAPADIAHVITFGNKAVMKGRLDFFVVCSKCYRVILITGLQSSAITRAKKTSDVPCVECRNKA